MLLRQVRQKRLSVIMASRWTRRILPWAEVMAAGRGGQEKNARMLILLPLRPDVDAAEAQAFLDQCLPESGAFVEAPCQPLFVPTPKNPAVGWWW